MVTRYKNNFWIIPEAILIGSNYLVSSSVRIPSLPSTHEFSINANFFFSPPFIKLKMVFLP